MSHPNGYTKEMTDNDIRKRLYEEQKNQIEQDMAPFGFISDGFDTESFVDDNGDRWHTDEYGDRWTKAGNGNETWNLDEYGDRSYMWDYM